MTADTPSLRFSGPFTVSGWFVYGHQYGNDPASTCLEKEGEFQLYYTGYENNRYRLRVGQVEVEEQTSGTTSGQWRFVIAWYDGTNACIQMDNGPVYSVAVPVSPDPTTNPVIALRRSGVSGGFAADEVFFFKRWLNPEERYALFNIGLRNILATNKIDLSMNLELRALLPREPQFVTTLSNFMCQPGGNVQFVLEARSVFPVRPGYNKSSCHLSGEVSRALKRAV